MPVTNQTPDDSVTPKVADDIPDSAFDQAPTATHVFVAISEVAAELARQGVEKLDKNEFGRWMYRGIDAVMNAVAPLLPAHKLLILPSIVELEQHDRQTQKGETQIHSVVTMEYTFVSAVDGSMFAINAKGEAMDKGDKSLNQACTAAYKEMLFKTFCIPVQGQGDPDAKSPEASKTIDRESIPPSGKALSGQSLVTPDDIASIRAMIASTESNEQRFCSAMGVESLETLPQEMFAVAMEALNNKARDMDARKKAQTGRASEILAAATKGK